MPIPSYATAISNNEETSTSNNIPSYATLDMPASSPITLSGIGNDIGTGINALGGTVGKGIIDAISGLVNTPIVAGDYLNRKLAGALGYDPNKISAPAVINPDDFSMPGVSPQLQQELNPIAETGASAALLAAPARDIALLGTAGAKGLADFAKTQLGLNAAQKAKYFMNDLLQGKAPADALKSVGDEIRNKYNTAKTNFSSLYDSMKNEAAERGYLPQIQKYTPGIDVAPTQKAIVPNNFNNALDKIDLTNHSSDIQDSINNFSNNPSFSSAHDLQSDLGNTGAKLSKSADKNDRQAGGQLLNLRNGLNNDITNTFTSNGDSDLADKYNSIGQSYKNIVAPYLSNPSLRNIVLKKGLSEINPTTISNLLSKRDAATTAVRNDLSDTSKNYLLGTNLKSAIEQLPTKSGALKTTVTPQDLISQYGALPNKGLDYLMTPSANMKIASIMGDLSKQSRLKWAMGLGIPALGLEGVRRYF